VQRNAELASYSFFIFDYVPHTDINQESEFVPSGSMKSCALAAGKSSFRKPNDKSISRCDLLTDWAAAQRRS
jgi:hypothetical protein